STGPSARCRRARSSPMASWRASPAARAQPGRWGWRWARCAAPWPARSPGTASSEPAVAAPTSTGSRPPRSAISSSAREYASIAAAGSISGARAGTRLRGRCRAPAGAHAAGRRGSSRAPRSSWRAARHALHDVGVLVGLGLRGLRRLRRCGHLEYAGALLALLADLHREVDVLERAALRSRELPRRVQRESRGVRRELEGSELARRRATRNGRTVDAEPDLQRAHVVAFAVHVAGGVAVCALQGLRVLERMRTLEVLDHIAVALLVLAARNHDAARRQVCHRRVLERFSELTRQRAPRHNPAAWRRPCTSAASFVPATGRSPRPMRSSNATAVSSASADGTTWSGSSARTPSGSTSAVRPSCPGSSTRTRT